MNGMVTGAVGWVLRLEGAAALVLAVILYRALGGGWGQFALLFLLPDVAMLGYLANRRLGAACYNALHTYLGPALLAGLGWIAAQPALWPLALIWAAHIGFDRMLGYGLKYPDAFGATHLGWKGRAPKHV